MKLWKRLIIVVATLTLIAAACGDDDAGDDAGDDAASDSTAEPSDEPDATSDDPQPVTLRVVGWKGGGTEIANIPELNAKFMEENPDIVVEYEFVARGDYNVFNNTRLSGGDAHDVLMVDKDLTQQWADAGFLRDLGDQPWVDRVRPEVVPFSQVDGTTYQFVQEVVPIGLFVNLELLDAAGIGDLPQTFDEFIATLETLRDAGSNGLFLPNLGGWSGTQMTFLGAANTVYVDNPGWNDQYNSGTTDFDPDWRVALEPLQQLLLSGLVDGPLMEGIDPWSDGLQGFLDGEWAFLPQGAWNLSSFADQASFEFAFMPLPASDAPRGFKFVGTGLAVNAASDVEDAALRYLDFWTQNENLQRFTEAENAFTTVTDGESPLAPQAASYVEADNAGRVIISPEQAWAYLAAGDNVVAPVIEQLFLDPSTDLSGLLQQFDAEIGTAR